MIHVRLKKKKVKSLISFNKKDTPADSDMNSNSLERLLMTTWLPLWPTFTLQTRNQFHLHLVTHHAVDYTYALPVPIVSSPLCQLLPILHTCHYFLFLLSPCFLNLDCCPACLPLYGCQLNFACSWPCFSLLFFYFYTFACQV